MKRIPTGYGTFGGILSGGNYVQGDYVLDSLKPNWLSDSLSRYVQSLLKINVTFNLSGVLSGGILSMVQA